MSLEQKLRKKYLSYILFDSLDDGNLRNIQYLLAVKKADPNGYLEDLDLCPMHCAVGAGTEDFAYQATYLCLKYGGDPNIRNSEGTTPLHLAAWWGRRKVAELLLMHGGDPLIKDADDNNALDLALANDQEHLYSRFIVHQWMPQKAQICSGQTGQENKVNNISLNERMQNQEWIKFAAEPTAQKTEVNNISLNGRMQNQEWIKFVAEQTAQKTENLNSDKDKPKKNFKSNEFDRFSFTDIESELNFVEIYVPELIQPNITPRKISISRSSSDVSHMLRIRSSRCSSSSTLTKCSSLQSLPSIKSEGSAKSWATEYVRGELKKLKIFHGPVVKTTKRLYIRQLKRFMKNPEKSKLIGSNDDGFNEVISNTFGPRLPELLSKWSPIIDELVQSCLEQPGRGSKERCFFTYILLDPFITCKLPDRVQNLTQWEAWTTFIKAIFYVGKGKNSRPLAHLYDAMKTTRNKTSEKIARIRYIWSSGSGVICVQAFHNLTEGEAFNREAAMIDALHGHPMLTNQQAGDYSGKVKYWSMKQKRRLGVLLLYRAMRIYIADHEREILPEHLKS
ncbi:hypothetical protein O3M35_000734 [Rhynocoris fuscipes]|uniref:LEM domain-containing protein n=1 Tax=Rhynocoris fuscipes TaxID=488301 RepID=A0AAW1DMM7_9HEMI